MSTSNSSDASSLSSASFHAVAAQISRSASFALYDSMAQQVMRAGTPLDPRQGVLAILGRAMGLEVLLGRLLRLRHGTALPRCTSSVAVAPTGLLAKVQQSGRKARPAGSGAVGASGRIVSAAAAGNPFAALRNGSKAAPIPSASSDFEFPTPVLPPQLRPPGAPEPDVEPHLCLVVVPDTATERSLALLVEDLMLAGDVAVAMGTELLKPMERARLYGAGGVVVVAARQLVADLLHRRVSPSVIAGVYVILRHDIISASTSGGGGGARAINAAGENALTFAWEIIRSALGPAAAAAATTTGDAASGGPPRGARLFVLADVPVELAIGGGSGEAATPPLVASLHIGDVQIFPRNSLAVQRHFEALGDRHGAALVECSSDPLARRMRKLLQSILREVVRELRSAASAQLSVLQAAADNAASTAPATSGERTAGSIKKSQKRQETTLDVMAALTVEQVLTAEAQGVQMRLHTYLHSQQRGPSKIRDLIASVFSVRRLLRSVGELSAGRFLLHLEAAMQPTAHPGAGGGSSNNAGGGGGGGNRWDSGRKGGGKAFMTGLSEADRAQRPIWLMSEHVTPLLELAQRRVFEIVAFTREPQEGALPSAAPALRVPRAPPSTQVDVVDSAGTAAAVPPLQPMPAAAEAGARIIRPYLGEGSVNAKLLAVRELVLGHARSMIAQCERIKRLRPCDRTRAPRRQRQPFATTPLEACVDVDAADDDELLETTRPATILVGVDDTNALREVAQALLAATPADIAIAHFNDFLSLYQLVCGGKKLTTQPQHHHQPAGQQQEHEQELHEDQRQRCATNAPGTSAMDLSLLGDTEDDALVLCSFQDSFTRLVKSEGAPPNAEDSDNNSDASDDEKPRTRAKRVTTADGVVPAMTPLACSTAHELLMLSQPIASISSTAAPKAVKPAPLNSPSTRDDVVDVDADDDDAAGDVNLPGATPANTAGGERQLRVEIDSVEPRRAIKLLICSASSSDREVRVPVVIVLQRVLTAVQLLATTASMHRNPVGRYVLYSPSLEALRTLDALASLSSSPPPTSTATPYLLSVTKPELLRVDGDDIAWSTVKLHVDAENRSFFGTWVQTKSTLSSELMVDRATRSRAEAELGFYGSSALREGRRQYSQMVTREADAAGGGGAASNGATPLVVFDERELRSTLPYHLYVSGIDVVPMVLLRGDYVLSPTMAVERKSVNDLIGSTIGRKSRLPKQLENMCRHFAQVVVLIEFERTQRFELAAHCAQSSYQILLQKLYKLLLSFTGVRMLWSRTPKHAARLIGGLKKTVAVANPDVDECLASNSPAAISAGVAAEIPGAQFSEATRAAQRMLLRFPGVTEQNAQSVMDVAGSLAGLATVTLQELVTAMGDERNAAALHDFLHRPLAETL